MENLKNKEEKQQHIKLSKIYPLGIVFLYLVLFSLFISCSDSPEIELSSVSKLEPFTFHPSYNTNLKKVVTGTISNFDITLQIPYDMSPDKLIATFSYTGASIQIGGVIQENGVTANNFSKPVVYTVIAEDGTKSDYTVTVTKILSSDSKVESFTFQPEHNGYLKNVVTGTISNLAITVSLPHSMSRDGLIATFDHTGKSIQVGGKQQVSGVTANNFSQPVVYTVIAEDKTKTNYTVTVNNLPRTPSVYITTTGGAPILNKEDYVTSTIKIEDLDKYFSSEVEFTAPAKIKGRGNSTWGMPKKPYRLKLDNKAPLLGMSNDKDWALLANYLDKTLLRNITAFEISRIAKMSWTPSSVSVDLYLNGIYQGVYALTEHVKVSEERLDMKLVKPSDNSGEALTGDYLLELDFHYDELYKFKTDKEKLPIMFKDPEEPSGEQFAFVKNFYNNAEQILYSSNFKDPVQGYRRYIDVESFIKYFIVQELAKNVDGNMRGSCYMGIRRNGKIEMPLVWDFDIAFGNADHITWEQGATSAEWDGWFIKTKAPWFDRFFEDPAFVAELKVKWNNLKPQLDELPGFIKQRALMINDSQVRNFSPKPGGAGWDIKKAEWNTKRIRGSYDAEVNYLVDFVERRIGWLDTNINKLK